MSDISIVIPSAKNETELQNLLDDLGNGFEIVVVSCKKPKNLPEYVKWIYGDGRAESLNTGAKNATKPFLWFLHADSKLHYDTISSLEKSISKYPEALHYFDLEFYLDGSSPPSLAGKGVKIANGVKKLMKLNTLGVLFRSRILKVPFGDQGFCISKEIFDNVGGYREDLPYGEDHVFVWTLRQNSIPIRPTMGKLFTSARKYNKQGWLYLTIKYQYLWIKQAIPELLKLLRQCIVLP